MGGVIAMEPFRSGVDLLPIVLFVAAWWFMSRQERKRRRERQVQPPHQAASRPGQPLSPRRGEGVDPLTLIQQMLFGGMELPPLGVESSPPAPPPWSGEQERGSDESEGGEGRGDEAPSPAARQEGVTAAPRPEWVREPSRQPVRPGATGQPRVGRRSSRLARVSREELQRAVIWAEVLAPPVALRDESAVTGGER